MTRKDLNPAINMLTGKLEIYDQLRQASHEIEILCRAGDAFGYDLREYLMPRLERIAQKAKVDEKALESLLNLQCDPDEAEPAAI